MAEGNSKMKTVADTVFQTVMFRETYVMLPGKNPTRMSFRCSQRCASARLSCSESWCQARLAALLQFGVGIDLIESA